MKQHYEGYHLKHKEMTGKELVLKMNQRIH